MSVGNKILTTVCACTINALQGNVPAITLELGIATHRTSFLANNFSTAIARYSLERPVNLMSASWFVSEMSVKRLRPCGPVRSCGPVPFAVTVSVLNKLILFTLLP